MQKSVEQLQLCNICQLVSLLVDLSLLVSLSLLSPLSFSLSASLSLIFVSISHLCLSLSLTLPLPLPVPLLLLLLPSCCSSASTASALSPSAFSAIALHLPLSITPSFSLPLFPLWPLSCSHPSQGGGGVPPQGKSIRRPPAKPILAGRSGELDPVQALPVKFDPHFPPTASAHIARPPL